MPSALHEVTIEFFRNQPGLAAWLLSEVLREELPDYEEARWDSADLPQIQSTEYRADAVITLMRRGSTQPAVGVVVEVQLRAEDRKRYTWPVYVATLRARLRCPVLLLVFTHDDAVARWSARPIDLGSGVIRPRAIGPTALPQITDVQTAKRNPELAVLSVMAHGRSQDSQNAARIACAAQQAVIGLDDDTAVLYLDIILSSVSEAARLELPTMIPPGYEFQSEFVRTHYTQAWQRGVAEGQAKGVAEGRAKGGAEGRASLIIRQLTLRFGPLTSDVQARISQMDVPELDSMGERLLTAPTLQDALEPK